MHCDVIAFAQATCLQLWEQCIAGGSALLSLFQRNIPDLAHPHSLADRTIQVGGVENTGNSCIFSAMLQDFAALPQIYDLLLSSPLSKGPDEPAPRFAAREAMQQNLWCCVEDIRSGKRVEHAQVRTLAEQLQGLGWQGHLSSAWRCFLNRLAPSIFPLPHFSVYELYEKTLHCLLEQVDEAPLQIVLTGKQDSRPFSEFFATHSEFSKMDAPSLWRVAVNASPDVLEEQFQIEDWEFSLQVVHAYQMTPSGKHVIIYRKSDEEWICCNDAQITQAAPSAADTIYTVVYESRRL